MKIQRLNENEISDYVKKEILKKFNDKYYVVSKTCGMAVVDHATSNHKDIKEAIRYYNKYKEKDENCYIYIMEVNKRIIPEEEIEFINTTNKYNL
jgi:hypothetical protein